MPVATSYLDGLLDALLPLSSRRLKAIKDLAQGQEDARAFNLLVVDYNSRCSDFLYQPQDLVAVVADVSANKSRFETDAKRIMSDWPGHSAEQHY